MLQILQITYILHFISELVLFPGVFVYSLICLFPACMLDCVLYATARPPQVDSNASSQHLRVWSSYSRQYSDVDSRPSVDQSINKVEKKKRRRKKRRKNTHYQATLNSLSALCLSRYKITRTRRTRRLRHYSITWTVKEAAAEEHEQH